MEQVFGTQPAEVPDFYVDSVRIGTGLYSFTLEMGLQGLLNAPGSEPPPVTTVVRVRMSPQHARVLAKLLRKHVDLYTQKVGPIAIPSEVLKDLGLPEED